MAYTWLKLNPFVMSAIRTECLFFCGHSSTATPSFNFVTVHIYFHSKQYLQVRAKEGLPLGVLVVVPHQQIEQRRRFRPQGGQLGDAALEHLAAQGLAQRHAALEEH